MASPVALLVQSRGPVHIKQTVAMGLSSENAHPVSPYCSPAPALPTHYPGHRPVILHTPPSLSTQCSFLSLPSSDPGCPVPMARGGPSQTVCWIPWSPLLRFRPSQMVPCLLTSISACIVPQTLWLLNLNVVAICPLPFALCPPPSSLCPPGSFASLTACCSSCLPGLFPAVLLSSVTLPCSALETGLPSIACPWCLCCQLFVICH